MNRLGTILSLSLLLGFATSRLTGQVRPVPRDRPPEENAPRKQEPVELTRMFPYLQWDRLDTWKTENLQELPLSRRGAYPVGDGWTFAVLGLGRRANTLQGITGPDFDTGKDFSPEGSFGENTLDLTVGGKAPALPVQRIGMARGAPLVFTEDKEKKGIALRVLTFAWSGPKYPPGLKGDEAGKAALDPFRCAWSKAPHRTIYRIVEVFNGTEKPLEKVDLVARFQGKGEIKGGSILFRHPLPGGKVQVMEVRFAERSKPAADGLHRGFDKIAPGKIGQAALLLHFYYQGQKRPDPDDYLKEDCIGAAGECQGWWHLRLLPTTRFRTDDRKYMDLIQGWKIRACLLQALPGGGVAASLNHRVFRVRDAAGAVLVFLRAGMWNEARRILDYERDCVRLTGKIQAQYPLTLAFPKGLSDPDWNRVTAGDPEAPSWMLLEHYWYYRATNDLSFLRKRWPFLKRLLDAQKPAKEDLLMPFSPADPLVRVLLEGFFPGKRPFPNDLPAQDAARGRTAYSMAASLLHLLSIHALADVASVIGNGAASKAEKAAWSKRKENLLERALKVGQLFESRFWLPRPGVKQEPGKLVGRYIPAFSPVTLEPHIPPVAEINLLPLWVGYLFATGNRDTANVKETVAALKLPGTRVGSTPDLPYALGCTQGYLVACLATQEDKSLPDAVEGILRQATPAGEWVSLYDGKGNPVAAGREPIDHLSLWDCGVNMDALLFALTGVRYAAVPAFDPSTLRLNPRIPKGATFFSGDGLRHDGRLFDFSMRLEGKRVNVRVLNRGTKQMDLALGLLHNMYVRYIKPNRDEYINEVSPGVFIDKDNPGYRMNIFGGSGRLDWGFQPLRLPPPGTDFLLFTYRPGREKALESRGKVLVVDLGLPILPRHLAQLLVLPDGRPRVPVLVFDRGVRETSPATMKTTAFWQNPALRKAMDSFRRKGGRIENL